VVCGPQEVPSGVRTPGGIQWCADPRRSAVVCGPQEVPSGVQTPGGPQWCADPRRSPVVCKPHRIAGKDCPLDMWFKFREAPAVPKHCMAHDGVKIM
jgi:hypothetical protein